MPALPVHQVCVWLNQEDYFEFNLTFGAGFLPDVGDIVEINTEREPRAPNRMTQFRVRERLFRYSDGWLNQYEGTLEQAMFVNTRPEGATEEDVQAAGFTLTRKKTLGSQVVLYCDLALPEGVE